MATVRRLARGNQGARRHRWNAAAVVVLAAALAGCSGSGGASGTAAVPPASQGAGQTAAAASYPFGGDACQALTDADIAAATGLTPTSHDTTTASGVTGGPHCYWHLPASTGQDVLGVEFGDLQYFNDGVQSNGGPSAAPVASLGDQAYFVPYANPDLWFTHGSYMVSVVTMGDHPLTQAQVEALARAILAKLG